MTLKKKLAALVLDLLEETSKQGCRISEFPIEQNHRIGSEESSLVEKTQYYAVRVVGQFMHDMIESHVQAKPRKKAALQDRRHFDPTEVDYVGFVVDKKYLRMGTICFWEKVK